MKVKIPKPGTEAEQVELFDTIACSLQAVDEDFPEYFLEPNIMDDAEAEDAFEFFKEYYQLERGLNWKIETQTDTCWEISIH